MTELPLRERRRRLDHESVIAAAETLVDRNGYDALTMTSLALELDVRVSSLYNHVHNLDDLRAAIQTRAMRRLGHEMRTAAMGRTGVDGVHALAEAFTAFARAAPHRYIAMTRTPLDRHAYLEASTDAAAALAVMIRTAGVPDDLVLQTQLALFSAIHGYISLELTGFFVGATDNLDSVLAQVVRGAVTAAVLTASDAAAPAHR
ncbi:WHG domain-containing protein [Aldersonia sp. NBC_00410]|uniref:TetR/AcrR family transcriptional regulator n=1 Tax=Aldersonia sp. NBC_00410 TaxID=2975954 RepID=UPI00225C0130|nr:TetR-like C-terminal domain-containing protein [Aldersonia sp. NBC_00410]MCX5045329.1 WHG domain-containing protein [Aldersonia sp. NBC_00410]